MANSLTISDRAEQIVEEFEMFDDWMERYEYLIELGRSLPLIDERYRTEDYLVRGCQSQVWLRAEADGSTIQLTADSDALITKGLVALLIRVLNGQLAAEIADADLSFLDRIGMKDHLSPNRKNGLDAMIKKIKFIAHSLSHQNQLP